LLLAVGAALLVLWAAEYFPAYQQPPHQLTACGKGGCVEVPPSEYYLELDELSVAIFVLAGLAISSGAWLFVRKQPTGLSIDALGFTVALGRRSRRYLWAEGRPPLELWDFRLVAQRSPQVLKGESALCSITLGRSQIPLPGAAFDALLLAARQAGSNVFSGKGQNKKYPEVVWYRVTPRNPA
jgi:hypothetical protein